MKVRNQKLYSGSHDQSIIIWDIESARPLEQLFGHTNGVSAIAFANGDLYTGSYDHYICCWDMALIRERIEEREA